jgi:outer membrane protein
MKQRFLLLSKAACAVAAAALSGAAGALDLVGAWEQARTHDPSTLAANEALQAGREKAVQGRALLLPQVALTASATRLDQRTSVNLPPALADATKPQGTGTAHQVAVQLLQPLIDAKARADKRELQEQTTLAEIRHRDALQDLLQRVAEAYFGVLMAQENLRVVQAEKAAVAMQRDRAQARFDVGRGKVTDLQEAQARYDTVLTREVSAQSTLALREAQYEALTGSAPAGLAGLRAGFAPAPPQPDSLPDWQARGLEGNTRVQVRRSELVIAGAEIQKYRLSGRPTLDLVASVTRQGQNGGLSPLVAPDSARSTAIGVQLNVPLFAGGALESRERESRATQRQAEQELAAAQRDMRLSVQDAYLAVKTGVARIASVEQSVQSARTALDATTLGRDVGTRTELDVLDAQQRLYSTQLELAQARNDYLLGRVRLAAAAGALHEGELRALNAYLDH